ncbi:MAG: hypothetical protein FWC95_07170, partial [Defluviitaleaceae bacterium]|nr:hypothetical protein [Defluviitaleaceae bacterium]
SHDNAPNATTHSVILLLSLQAKHKGILAGKKNIANSMTIFSIGDIAIVDWGRIYASPKSL